MLLIVNNYFINLFKIITHVIIIGLKQFFFEFVSSRKGEYNTVYRVEIGSVAFNLLHGFELFDLI